jgi:hypothetical protein
VSAYLERTCRRAMVNVCVCVCVCVDMCMHAYVCVCARAHARARTHTHTTHTYAHTHTHTHTHTTRTQTHTHTHTRLCGFANAPRKAAVKLLHGLTTFLAPRADLILRYVSVCWSLLPCSRSRLPCNRSTFSSLGTFWHFSGNQPLTAT